jgi:Na+:H+ antiporter, NhaA family
VFGATWLLVRFAGARLPEGANWVQFAAVCLLCGIGFTMSLFIGTLAFEGQGPAFETQLKLGVLCGSLLSALAGSALMLAASGRVARNSARSSAKSAA